MIDKKIMTGILAAFGASLCCITPVLAVLAGSAGMASTFSWMEPFRPYLIGLTILVLAFAWWDKLRPAKEVLDCSCDIEGEVSFWSTKKFLFIVTVLATLMLSFQYWGDRFISSDKVQTIPIDKNNLSEIRVDIEGMTCKACEATIEKYVFEVKGVTHVKASSSKKEATVKFDKTQTDINYIMKAISKTGYKPLGFSGKFLKDKTTSKSGGGKCGAGKCGSGKYASKE